MKNKQQISLSHLFLLLLYHQSCPQPLYPITPICKVSRQAVHALMPVI